MWKWLKKAAVIAVPLLIGVAVTVATGGLGAPLLVAVAAGGFAAGASASYLDSKLKGEKPRLSSILTTGAVSAVLSVATLGVGRLLAPVVSKALPAAQQRLVVPITNAAVGTLFGGGTRVASNAVAGRPLGEGVLQSSLLGGAGGAALGAAARVVGLAKPQTTPRGRVTVSSAADAPDPVAAAAAAPTAAEPPPPVPATIYAMWRIRGPVETYEVTARSDVARQIVRDLFVRTETRYVVEVPTGHLVKPASAPPFTFRVSFAADDLAGQAELVRLSGPGVTVVPLRASPEPGAVLPAESPRSRGFLGALGER